MKAIGFTLAVLLAIVVYGFVWLACFGVTLGAANAWIIQDTFGEAWHAVWRRWPISLLWGLLFGGFLRGSQGRRS